MLRRVLLLGALALCQAIPVEKASQPLPVEPVALSHLEPSEVRAMQPHIIARFEELLQRASEILRPGNFQLVEIVPDVADVGASPLPEPHQQMQPPTEQPYNFYLPQFDNVASGNEKLDAMSRRLEKFAPPPQHQRDQRNYYADKPNKLPKKFNAATKWLNAREREAVLPKVAYLVSDERNRINFDNSFFGGAMQGLDNINSQKDLPSDQTDAVSGQAGDEPTEDLVAVPATQQLLAAL